jgi:hypothetical protein
MTERRQIAEKIADKYNLGDCRGKGYISTPILEALLEVMDAQRALDAKKLEDDSTILDPYRVLSRAAKLLRE